MQNGHTTTANPPRHMYAKLGGVNATSTSMLQFIVPTGKVYPALALSSAILRGGLQSRVLLCRHEPFIACPPRGLIRNGA